MDKTPPIQIKIATLAERLKQSAAVPLEKKLAALKKQAGQPTRPDPIAAALAYRESMRKVSKGD